MVNIRKLHKNNTYLMGAEFRIIQFPACILHVLISQEFAHTSTIFVDICITHITSFSHVILQVLPASSWW